MTRTIYYTATTLDGFLADEQDSLDWLFVQDHDQSGPMNHEEFMAGVGALVMGATTYAWIRDHLAKTGEKWSYAAPSWVLTHQDLEPLADNVRFARGDVGAVHAEAVTAAAGKDVWVVGGGPVAAQFAEAGLLDELMVSIAPVTLGSGRPLLPGQFDLRLTRFDRNGAFLCAWYDVVGPRT